MSSGRHFLLPVSLFQSILAERPIPDNVFPTYLDQKEAFMYRLVPVLIEVMGKHYPELVAQQEFPAVNHQPFLPQDQFGQIEWESISIV